MIQLSSVEDRIAGGARRPDGDTAVYRNDAAAWLPFHRTNRGMTPLMLAVASETQDVEVVKLLVKAGADPNIRDTSGETALGWASRYGSRSVLDALKLAGAQGSRRSKGVQRC